MNSLFLASLLSALFLGLSQAASDWHLVPLCQNGTRQSPIDIKDCDAVHDATKTRVKFHWPKRSDVYNITIGNDGETAYLEAQVFTEYIGLDSGKFVLYSINVHWGGSEHAVNGVKYAGELELFFFNENFTMNENSTIEKDDDLIVVSILLQEDRTLKKDIKFLKDLKECLPNLVDPNTSKTFSFVGDTVALGCLIPKDRAFYRYTGSMSIEPCEEGVERIVFKNPIIVSSSFFSQLRTLKTEAGGFLYSSVNRPLQEENGRVIYKSEK